MEIPERLQNAFAAMAGSGPAYIYQVAVQGLRGGLSNEHSSSELKVIWTKS